MEAPFVRRRPDRVVIEVCPSAGWITDLAARLGIELQVADPSHEGWRRRRVKKTTDRVDALTLARLSAVNQLPLVAVPSKAVREWRSLIQYRQSLVARRTAIKNTIHSILTRQTLRMPTGRKGWTNAQGHGLERLAASIERLTHQVGEVAANAESGLAERMKRWEVPEPEVTPDRLYVAVDGVMVHEKDGLHEARRATCYWEDASGKRQAQYMVRFETAALFAAFVWSLACRCGLKHAKDVVLSGDGAKWIWDQIAPLLEGATCIVDWYHAMEHVWECGRKLYGEGTETCTAWIKTIESLLWDGHDRAILEHLRADRAQARSPTRRKAISELIRYLGNQDDRLAYDRFRTRELDIGSGRVEAACKSEVGTRMKRSGKRWSRRGSQTTLSLRVTWLNERWEELWTKRPLAA